MAVKKDSFKFTIQFSPGDPLHQQTAALLNEQGRRKAQFIVNAVTHYLNCKETPASAAISPLQMDRAVIEAVVMQVLEQRLQTTEKDTKAGPPVKSERKPVKKSESLSFHEVADALGEEGIDAIMSSLAAIQSFN